MQNYEKFDSGPNIGLVKSCAYKKLIMPPPVDKKFVPLTFKPIPKALSGKMGCPKGLMTACSSGRKMATKTNKPDGGYAWFDNRLKALEKAIKNNKIDDVRKNAERLNIFIQAVKTYNEQEKKKKPTDLSRRVYGLKWYSHSLHDKLLELNNNAYLKKYNIILQTNDIIYCANDAVAGCNNGKWEAGEFAKTNPNCMKKQPKAAFGSTIKSKAKPLIKPATKTTATKKKFRCASKLSGVERGKKYNTKAEAEGNCDLSREKVVEVDAWVTGGRKSRRRRKRRRSRKKGRKSRKSRRRNKRKSRKRRSRRKSRKRRRR